MPLQIKNKKVLTYTIRSNFLFTSKSSQNHRLATKSYILAIIAHKTQNRSLQSKQKLLILCISALFFTRRFAKYICCYKHVQERATQYEKLWRPRSLQTMCPLYYLPYNAKLLSNDQIFVKPSLCYKNHVLRF